MRIYNERIPVADIPDCSNEGRLTGINILTDDGFIMVEPIYHKIVSVYRSREGLIITIGWSKPEWVVVLRLAWPAVFVVKVEKEATGD